MKYLFIDSATANLVVAIIIDSKIEYLYNKKVGKDMSVEIMSAVQEALEKTKIKVNQLDKIFVVNGPGSFTGIRVGLTVAKTLSWALNIPVIPLSSLEVIASTKHDDSIALIDARRGYVFAGGYDKDLNNTYSDRHVLLKDITAKGIFISYDDIPNSVKPDIDVLKVIKRHETDNPVNPHILNPNYLKLTEAEERLNDRNKNS